MNPAWFAGDRIDHQGDNGAFTVVPTEAMVEIEKADMQTAPFGEIALA